MLTRYRSHVLPCSVPKADGGRRRRDLRSGRRGPPPLERLSATRKQEVNEVRNTSWIEMHEEVASLKVQFSDASPSEEPHVVTLFLRTGEERTLSGLSLSSQPLHEQEDYVLSVTLAMAVLTQLLSSWTASVLRTTAVQPRILITFLMACEMITKTMSHLAVDALDHSAKPRGKPWSRNN